MAFCLGPFCGKFRDELGGSSDSDEEEDTKMKGKSKKKKSKRIKTKPQKGGASSSIAWAPYLSQVRMHVKVRGGGEGADTLIQVTQLTAVDSSVTEGMLNRLNQLQQVYVIKIVKCGLDKVPPGLDELDNLYALTLSNNSIRKISPEMAECQMLQQLILDWNHISEISAGLFGQKSFTQLEVLNLSHNRLSFLPNDFGQTAGRVSNLKYVDLSYNALGSIPDRLMQCRQIEELNLSHNCLRELPVTYDLVKLKKLFVSFNELRKLPENIGDSKDLLKLRITSNKIQKLPLSILKLWKQRNGKLEELLVERNPLQIPSITAFEMRGGETGMDDALHLLEDYGKELQEEEEKKRMEALENDIRIRFEQQHSLGTETAEPGDIDAAAPALNMMQHIDPDSALDDWYFGYCKGDQAKITAIRDEEQAMMIWKRHFFLNTQQKHVKAILDKDGKVPHRLEVFLDPASFLKFKEQVPVQDIDLFFILFVYASKKVYASAEEWFNKYHIGGAAAMTKDEFYELCLASKLDVRKKYIDELWCSILRLPPSEKEFSETKIATLTQFVAACHVHDIEDKDTWLTRMSVALRLHYYDMSVTEMARRAKARSNQEATPQTNFATESKPDHEDDLMEDLRLESEFENGVNIPILKDIAGLKGINLISPRDQEHSSAKIQPKELQLQELGSKVSITDYEQKLLRKNEEEGDNDDVMSVESDQLSEDDASEMSELDAQAFLCQEIGEETSTSAGAMNSISRLLVNGDSALTQLMQADVKDFFRGQSAQQRKTEATSPWMRPVLAKKTRSHEASMDTMLVRQAIRDVYRNMPYFDFLIFLNFLLRGLHRIQAEEESSNSYWHMDDPIFQSAMALNSKNKYAVDLLEKMGFVRVADVYWLWPDVHLKEEKNRIFWGMSEVPQNCPGSDRTRLQDMISLLTACLVSLNLQGKSFTGHFDSRLSG